MATNKSGTQLVFEAYHKTFASIRSQGKEPNQITIDRYLYLKGDRWMNKMNGEQNHQGRKESVWLNINEKGKRGEREVAKIINKTLGVNCRRTPNSGGLSFKGDIIDIDIDSHLYNYHFEIKNTKSLVLPKWIKQAEGDCPVVKTPILIYKHQGKWRADMRLNDWLGDQLTIQELLKNK